MQLRRMTTIILLDFSKLVPTFVESDPDAFFLQFEDLAAGMK